MSWLPYRKNISESKFLAAENRRLELTLGLFCLGLIVPLLFLFNRFPLQSKMETFRAHQKHVEHFFQYVEQNIRDTKQIKTPHQEVVNGLRRLPIATYGKLRLENERGTYWIVQSENEPDALALKFFLYTRPLSLSKLSTDEAPFLVEKKFVIDNEEMTLKFSTHAIPFTNAELLLALDGGMLLFVLISGFLASIRMGLGHISLIGRYRNFVSAVSHEFRTPLAAIRLHSEMLSNGRVQTEDEIAECSGYLIKESARLDRLVNDLLILAKSDSVLKTEKLSSKEINDLIKQSTERVQHVAHSNEMNINIVSQKASEEYYMLNKDALVASVSNLIENAIKFSKHADERYITLSWHIEQNGELTIQVRDFGSGFQPSEEKLLFAPFYRAKDGLTRETQGVGIGLSLVKELTEKMSGFVSAKNCTPGAQFSLHFPALRN